MAIKYIPEQEIDEKVFQHLKGITTDVDDFRNHCKEYVIARVADGPDILTVTLYCTADEILYPKKEG